MNLSKSDKRNLELLVTHFNFRVDDVESLTSLFNGAIGSFLRSSSGPAVRAKRAKALEETFLSSFPTQTLRSGRTNKEVLLDNMERARVSELTVGSVNWPKV